MTSDGEPGDRAGKSKHEPVDPLEDRTQPMPTKERPASLPNASEVSDPSETTTWAGAPPPIVILDEEETVVSAAFEVSAPDSDSTETVVARTSVEASRGAPIAPSSALRPILLERIQPSLGRGERLRLDASHWRVSLGRAEDSDIRLYTASASREHARIEGSEDGDWVLTPSAGRSVLIDGESVVEPIVLETGMNIVLGQDHLRCVTEGLDRGATAAATIADGFKGSAGFQIGKLGVAGLIAAAVTLIGIAWALMTSGVD